MAHIVAIACIAILACIVTIACFVAVACTFAIAHIIAILTSLPFITLFPFLIAIPPPITVPCKVASPPLIASPHINDISVLPIFDIIDRMLMEDAHTGIIISVSVTTSHIICPCRIRRPYAISSIATVINHHVDAVGNMIGME
jgi:hypothetical protein